jgi:acyl-CoA synthetase (NDP forming)
MADLERLFAPGSVAVIGAAESIEKIGGRALRVLLKHGYRGRVYPINPRLAEVAGLKSYASIAEVPEAVDLVIVAIPAVMVPGVVEQCAAAGVKAAVILSSGFKETGEEGARLEARLREVCERTGIRISGPNSEGLYGVGSNTAATFNSAVEPDSGDLGAQAQIGIVSQSGGLAFALYNKGRHDGLVISHVVSVGNQTDLESADYVAHLIEQERIRAVVMYVEAFKQPAKFLAAARRAAALGKPIVMAKVGRSDAGSRAARSHTGAMASPRAVVDAVLDAAGIVQADEQQQLLDIAAVFAGNPLPRGRRVGIVSISGGTAAWLADACSAAGLEVPELDAECRARIARTLPSYASSNNPVDVTAQAGEGFLQSLDIIGEAANIDAIIVAANFAGERRLLREGRAIADWMRRVGKPVLLYSYAYPSDQSRQILRDLGIRCYTSLQGCVRSLKSLADYADFQASRRERVAPQRTLADVPAAAASLLASARGTLCEYEAKQLLAAYGVPIPEERVARSAAEAVAHAERLGYPVALKVQSPDIAHKTEAGAVMLGLSSAGAVREAYDCAMESARRFAPDAAIHGMLVQKMARRGLEMIAGIVNDRDYGPLVMVGFGGIHAEVLDDKMLAPAPLTAASAQRMLARLRGYRLLLGVRGEPARDIEALVDFLVRLSHLAWDARNSIAEFDVNPVFVHEAGHGISIVDALAVCRAEG